MKLYSQCILNRTDFRVMKEAQTAELFRVQLDALLTVRCPFRYATYSRKPMSKKHVSIVQPRFPLYAYEPAP